ncbi:MAG: hypothetical protein ACRDQ5_09480 [Sciscionella sp.]
MALAAQPATRPATGGQEPDEAPAAMPEVSFDRHPDSYRRCSRGSGCAPPTPTCATATDKIRRNLLRELVVRTPHPAAPDDLPAMPNRLCADNRSGCPGDRRVV